jgi:hypothetical protein
MNKQIQRLAKQAFDVVNDGVITNIKIPKLFVEMFADLIIKECADIAQQHNKSPVAAPLAIGYVIREHFGVEE